MRALAADKFLLFRRWLQPTDAQGKLEAGIEATFLATFRHPEAGLTVAYAKLYPDLDGMSRGLVNEITGYAMAKHFGLPQPSPAFLAEIPLRKLDLKGIPVAHAWVKDAARKLGRFPAWCTADAGGETPVHHFGPDAAPAIRADLEKWSELHRAAAFDHIIANVDRNLRNLLRTGPSRYLLIDHGQLARQGHWIAADLNPDQTFRNVLLDFMQLRRSRQAASAMVYAAEEWAPLGLPDTLPPWWLRLLPETDVKRFDNFLRHRAKYAATHFIANYNLLC